MNGLPPILVLTEADVKAAAIGDAISGIEPNVIELFSGPLMQASQQAAEATDERRAAVLGLLGTVASFGLSLEKPQQPFVPMFTSKEFRTLEPDDLSTGHFEMLEVIVRVLSDVELRARVADVLWSRPRKSVEHGRIAFFDYLQRAKDLDDPHHWPRPMTRLERAFQIARMIGGESSEYRSVVAYIRERLLSLGATDPLFFSTKLMELLLKTKLAAADMDEYVSLATETARRAMAEGDPHRARAYLAVAEQLFYRKKDSEGARNARLSIAESFVLQGRAQTSGIAAASFYRQAITEYRRVGKAKNKVDAVMPLLHDAQARSLSEMKTISQSTDITDQVQWARKNASGKSLSAAIRQMVTMVKIPSKEYLRTFVTEMMEKTPLRSMIAATRLSSDARVTGVRQSASADGDSGREAFIEAEMVEQASLYHGLFVNGLVEPYRYQLSSEHSIRLSDMLETIRSRPFVPAGREMLFAKGLLAGFDGDYATAAHLLVPQVENSLREILRQSGETVVGLDKFGIQDVIDLNEILDHPALPSILGEDLVFDLKGLLVSRAGANFRNNLSHGLLDYASSMSMAAAYTWWITLYLCVLLSWVNPNEQSAAEHPDNFP